MGKFIATILLISFSFSGCANRKIEMGMKFVKTGNFKDARNVFIECVRESGDPACMNNVGMTEIELGNRDAAHRWFSLSARYGNSYAVSNLIEYGWEVPPRDQQMGNGLNLGTFY